VPFFNNLYVKNFSADWTSEDLKKMFEPFGEILSASVMVDNEGKSRGFGFVCFKDPVHAQKALQELEGREELFVCKAVKKSARDR